MEAIVFILQLLSVYMPVISNELVNLIIELIDGVSLAIYNNTDRIIGAVRHVLGAVIDFILAAVQELVAGIPGVGGKISDEIGKLRSSVQEHMNEQTGAEDGAKYPKGLAEGASAQSGLLEDAGTNLGDTLKTGATSALSTLSPEVKDLLSSQLSG
jgi:phage-related protein